jgi:hypothetical protein
MYNVAETRIRRTAENNFMKRMSGLTDCRRHYARKSLETCTGAVEKSSVQSLYEKTVLLFSVLGAFAKLRKATISVVMSVRPHATTQLPLDGFS